MTKKEQLDKASDLAIERVQALLTASTFETTVSAKLFIEEHEQRYLEAKAIVEAADAALAAVKAQALADL